MSSNWLDNVLSPGIIFRPPNLSLITEKLGSNILDTKKPNFNHFHKKKKKKEHEHNILLDVKNLICNNKKYFNKSNNPIQIKSRLIFS
jgi:hypothetical protein